MSSNKQNRKPDEQEPEEPSTFVGRSVWWWLMHGWRLKFFVNQPKTLVFRVVIVAAVVLLLVISLATSCHEFAPKW